MSKQRNRDNNKKKQQGKAKYRHLNMMTLNKGFTRAAFVMFAAAVVCLGIYYSFTVSLHRQQLRFEEDALAVTNAYRSAMDVVEGMATSLNALQPGDAVTQSTVARTLVDKYPFISGFGRFSALAGTELNEFAKTQIDGEGGPAVWWFDDAGNRVTAGLASGYLPPELANRQYLAVTSAYTPAPTASVSAMKGFDLGSVERLADAQMRAARRGTTEIARAPSQWYNPEHIFALRSVTNDADATSGFWIEIDLHALGQSDDIFNNLGVSFSLIANEPEFVTAHPTPLQQLPLADSDLLLSQWLAPNQWVDTISAGDGVFTLNVSRHRGMTPASFMLWLAIVSVLVVMAAGIAVLNAKRLKAVRQQRLQSEKLFLEQQRAAVTLSHVSDAVISTDVNGRIQYVNNAAAEMLEVVRDNIIGQSISSIFRTVPEGVTKKRSSEANSDEYYATANVVSCDRYLLRVDGSRIAVNETVSPVRDAENNRTGSVVVLRDVTAEKELTRQLEYQINHDPLTGLANRLNFENRMRVLIEEATEECPDHALCLIDLDRFKQVNDTCGHAAGDQLLVDLAGALQARIRSEDLLARLGGDEFAIVLEQCDLEAARSVANRLHRFFNNYHFEYDGKVFPVRGSIGLVPFTPVDADFELIAAAADAACYRAKTNGRNSVHVQTEKDMRQSRNAEELWLPRIEDALQNDGFELHVQPICALEQGRFGNTCFHEFFVRMRDGNDPDKLYYPLQFMKPAERYGLTNDIDEWVISSVLGSIARLPDAYRQDLFSINLSASTVVREDFAEYLASQLRKYSVRGS
ncbi:MAG: diguanylate cyclase, partial [Pseudomonadota bacterium]